MQQSPAPLLLFHECGDALSMTGSHKLVFALCALRTVDRRAQFLLGSRNAAVQQALPHPASAAVHSCICSDVTCFGQQQIAILLAPLRFHIQAQLFTDSISAQSEAKTFWVSFALASWGKNSCTFNDGTKLSAEAILFFSPRMVEVLPSLDRPPVQHRTHNGQ